MHGIYGGLAAGVVFGIMMAMVGILPMREWRAGRHLRLVSAST